MSPRGREGHVQLTVTPNQVQSLPRAAQQRNHTTLSHLSPSKDTPPLKSSRSLSSLVHRTRGVPRRYTETVVATKQLLVLLPSAKTSPVSRHDDSTASRIIATSTHPLQLEHATMDSASTDATLVVDLGVGASTGTPTLASGRDVPRSPASPPSNGHSSTPNHPHALPIEHRSSADEEPISTPHAHFSNSRGNEIAEVAREGENERALAPALPPAPNIGRPSGLHRTDGFGPSEVEVPSPDVRLRAASTSSNVSQFRRPSPHWTDGLRSDPLPNVPLPPSTESVEQPYVLPEVIVTPLRVSFEVDGRENIGGPSARRQDVMKPPAVEVPPDESIEQVENAVPFGPKLRNDVLLDRFVVTSSGSVDPSPPLPCDQHEGAAQGTPPLRSRLAARLKIRVPEISRSISHIGQRARGMLHVPKLTVVASAYAPDPVITVADRPRVASLPAGGYEDVDDFDSDTNDTNNTSNNRRASTTASIGSQHGQGCWLCC